MSRAGRVVGSPSDRDALWLWICSRLATYLTVAVTGYLLARGDRLVPYLSRWRQWDVVHYQAIARAGYDQPGSTPYEAFFPGLPLLLRPLHLLGMDLTAAGLLVSATAGAVAVLALARLGELEGPPGTGPRAVLLLVVSPCAVFLAAGYTEALFLGLALPAWLAAHRGRWLLAGALAAGASSVRVTGLFLAVALVVEWATARPRPRRRADVAALVLPFLPALGYMAWLRATTGDWLAWVSAQREGWYRDLTDPVTALTRTWEAAFGGGRPLAEVVMFRAELGAVAVGLLLTGWLLRRRRWGESTYVGLQVLALATSTWFFSVPRATLLWWPLWLLLARATLRHRWALPAYVALSAPLAVLWTVAFATGRWAG